MFSRLSSRIYSSKCLLNQHQIKLGENNICTTGTFGIMMPVNRLHEAGQPASWWRLHSYLCLLHCNLNDKFSPNNRVIILHGNNIKCFQSNGPHTPCWCSSSCPCERWRVSDIKEVREDNLNEFVQVQVLVRDGCTFRVYYSTCIIRHCPQLVKFVWKFR